MISKGDKVYKVNWYNKPGYGPFGPKGELLEVIHTFTYRSKGQLRFDKIAVLDDGTWEYTWNLLKVLFLKSREP